ncbi:MAG: hypothetical protein WCO07_03045 [bacterium]
MYFSLILFFISLAGIIIMIGRKLVFIKDTEVKHNERFMLEVLDLDGIKHITVKNIKKYGFVALVTTLRFSIKSSHFLKNGVRETKNKMKHFVEKRLMRKEKESKEKQVSSFLKMVSDYKHRIREIKHKIKEEEGIK